ncbi:reprolysin-like metallopeptidase [Chryseobacterium sp.]|uniref:reprolysin-like metallopeptidase n=1 Tax=Chryseobacterium sp. TaxID=1871047 RepID=UPI00289E83E4|nr:zinc-dependent metalloprotease family protein [Chryseobacterium sp.]
MKRKIVFICALAGCISGFAQRWTPVSQKVSQVRKEVEVKQSYQVDLSTLKNLLKDAVETGKNAHPVIVSLPTAEGKIERFAVYSNPVMEKSLVDKYQLGSYVGIGVDDPAKYLRFSTAPTEMQSMIIKDGVLQFIEPISTDKQTYGVFYKTKKTGEHGFECEVEEPNFKDLNKLVENGKKQLSGVGITNRPSNTKYRDFRMALSVTGEYSQFFLTAAGIPTTATDDVKKSVVLTAMNNTMTRINGVFERDFGAHFTVQNLPGIVYLDPTTDPYTESNLSRELQQTLTAQVGNGNYDIGHVFHHNLNDRSGNAGVIGAVCNDPNPAVNGGLAKGSAYSQSPQPLGEDFDFLAAHEMGHQLGANHTFSMRSEGSRANVEPGGGTTIMGYPGITHDNVQMNFDGYFHYKSIDQVLTNLENKPACGVQAEITINTAPVISALTAYTIPKGTAYYLEAVAVDSENDAMGYTWEQYNSVGDNNSISGDSGWGYNSEGALARSFVGTANNRRYFPKLETVMNGVLTDKQAWETVSYIARDLDYAVTVRDQNAQRPMTSTAETRVTVTDDGPFKFNGLTTSSVLYNNAPNTIYWEVANTNTAPYNSPSVKIDYTSDNGLTWTDLIASTPNTGSYSAQMPGNLTGSIKLRISAIGNVFYAVSPAINVGTAPTSTTAAPTGVSTIATEIFKTTARVSWNNVPGATYTIKYRKAGTTSWSNVTSLVNSVVLSNLEDETNYEVQVATAVNNVPGTFSNNYTFKTKGLITGVDYCLLNTGFNMLGTIAGVKLANIDYFNPSFRSYNDISEDAQQIINLVAGTQYTLSVFAGSASDYAQNPYTINAWIDYNRNGAFETSEKVMSTLAIGTGTKSVTFTVPNTAYTGDKTLRLRVAGNFGTALANACGSTNQAGSIRDLSVKIANNANLAVKELKETKSEVSIYPNPADTFVEVKNVKEKADYKIYSADGRLVQQGQTDDNNRIKVASLLKGMYVITLKDDKNTYNTKLIKK